MRSPLIGETCHESIDQYRSCFRGRARSARPDAWRDEYEADVAVTIRRGDGKTVLAVQAEGRFLLVNLPDGTYTIQARKDGKPMQRTVTIKRDGHQRVVFEWK